MSTRIAVLMGGILLATSVNASAQTSWDDRIFLNVSVGGQVGSRDTTVTLSPTVYGEPASISTIRSVGGSALYDVTVGRPISGNLGAAFSLSGRSASGDATMSASIPDPVFFDRPRTVTDNLPDMTHSERWFGFLATWRVPVNEKFDALLLVGPAVASVKHAAPTVVTVVEQPGGPQVTPTTENISKSFVGIQAGADLRYMLTENFGVGGFLRVSNASGTLVGDSDLSVGGFQVGVGVRVRY